MGTVTVELALDCRCVLGESPVALPDGRVLLVDINGKKILGVDSLTGSPLPPVHTPQMPGCIVPRASSSDSVVAGLEDCVACISLSPPPVEGAAANLSLLAQLPEHLRGAKKRCNDGKCDPQGRLWVGTMHASWRKEETPRGALLCLAGTGGHREGGPAAHAEAELQVRVPETRLANGLAWSSDSSLLFFIDSALRRVDCFDFDASSGHVSNRRPVVTFTDPEPCVPDGMAIDASGKLWVVIGESGTVRQVDPETGSEVSRVQLPVQRPTSCAFGGKDLSELFITTREETGPSPHPSAGGFFKAHVPGVKGPTYAAPFDG